MKTRRDFFKSAAVLGALGASGLPLSAAEPESPSARADDRAYWLGIVDKVSRPVLENLSRRELRKRMPVEEKLGARRAGCSHLEAFGRLLYGIAPWLACEKLSGDELKLQQEFIRLAQFCLDAATDLKSADFLNFSEGGQALVDSAFFAQGILRAPKVLWEPLEPRVKNQIIAALKSSRKISTPDRNNWVMFAATVESALLEFGEPTLPERLENCVRKMLKWYVGDGAYGDGEFFHFDYYNSFVIQPMLLDVLTVLERHDQRFTGARGSILRRARRYAEVLERHIAPDGTFPPLGRSLTYRCGAFQLLAQIALLKQLPNDVSPAQVRCALTAVIRRTLEAPDTFDAAGWLRIGLAGHQPGLGENYISTGSLYLCAAAWLPLGLPPQDDFWAAAPEPWTSQKIWRGNQVIADHAMSDAASVKIPDLVR